jgi:hypothetical protein
MPDLRRSHQPGNVPPLPAEAAMMTPAYSITIDIDALASALTIDRAKVIEAFQDGRVCSRFVELWAESRFGLIRHANSNHPSSDGYFMTADGDNIQIAVRTLTRSGVRFQDSRFIGSGRSCSIDDLKASIRRSDKWFIFDIRFFPTITLLKLRCALLEQWIDSGELTPAGLSANNFAQLLNRIATPMVRQISMSL